MLVKISVWAYGRVPFLFHRANCQVNLSKLQPERKFLRLSWRADFANPLAFGGNCCNTWCVNLGRCTSDTYIRCEQLSPDIMHWAHRSRLEGHVPKTNERGYWYTLRIQRALPLIQTLLKYFDQKSYREWYGTSENWVKMGKFTCFLYIWSHFMNKNDKKHVNLPILTQLWDVPYHSR